MISASCPSCGSPLAFRSAAAVTAVCGQCQSTVVRTDDAVKKIGEIACFVRELSPIQIGARGVQAGRRFEVVGVIRRERPGVRWNEWYLLFDDGRDGWLGESNGQLWLFADPPLRPASVVATHVGEKLDLGGKPWVVAEVAEAAITAAGGELPFDVFGGRTTRYADLKREAGVGVGTIDFEEDPPQVWLGGPVDLVELKMEGLRAFAGWSDPVLTAFAGPELQSTQSLACPGCGAPFLVRAAGASQRRVCEYCGRAFDLDAEAGAVTTKALRGDTLAWKPPFPLGTRAKLGGVEWEIIGAMERYVVEDGQQWPWREYFLHNPWRGYRWLVESNGHLSVVDLLAGTPSRIGGMSVWNGERFRPFQGGVAIVGKLAGEFTWEVARGERAETMDAISPPRMLSVERSAAEETWSLGTYLPWDEVEGELKALRMHPSGVSPHQPNPEDAPEVEARGRRHVALLALAAIATLVVHFGLTLLYSGDLTTQSFAAVGVGEVVVTEPFTAAGPSGVYHAEVSHPGNRDVIVSLINLDNQRAIDVTYHLGGGPQSQDFALAPGAYIARLEVRDPPSATVAAAAPGAPLSIRVSRDVGGLFCPVLAILFAALSPVIRIVARGQFEQQRWSTSSFSGTP